MLAEARRINKWAAPHIGPTKSWALRHSEHRLAAEVSFLRELLGDVDQIVGEAASDGTASI